MDVTFSYFLLPHASPLQIRAYTLSVPEIKAIEEYVNEALDRWYIHPFTSLTTTSFFFGEKKDRRLQPCIDYRGINVVQIKYTVITHFLMFFQYFIFTELDLCIAFNLIHIGKVLIGTLHSLTYLDTINV